MSLFLVSVVSPALALDYDVLDLMPAGAAFESVAVSDAGDACVGWRQSGTTTLTWVDRDDLTSTPFLAHRGVGGETACYEVSDAGFATGPSVDHDRNTGFLYDASTGSLTALTGPADSYAVPRWVDDFGDTSGILWEGVTGGGAWWGPTGGDARDVPVHDTNAPSVSAMSKNGVLLLYGTAGSPRHDDWYLYDLRRFALVTIPGTLPNAVGARLLDDGTVLVGDQHTHEVSVRDPVTRRIYPIPVPTGGQFSDAGASPGGGLAGSMYDADGNVTPVCWNRGHGTRELDTTGFSYAYALDINDAGQVLGVAYASGYSGFEGTTVVWDCATGARTDISPESGTYTYPTGITESGIVLLSVDRASGRDYRMYDTRDGTWFAVTDAVGATVDQSIYEFGWTNGDFVLVYDTGEGDRMAYFRRAE